MNILFNRALVINSLIRSYLKELADALKIKEREGKLYPIMKKEDFFLEITYLDLKEYQAGKIGDKEKEEENWLEEGRKGLRGKEKEAKRINVASLGVFARKIMAQEWAKIKGRKLSPIYIRALEEEIRQRREKI